MIEILKLLEEIEDDIQTDRNEWIRKTNERFNHDPEITWNNYYPTLCGVLDAKIGFVILKVKRYIEDYEFMQKKLREKWEAEKEEEEYD